MANPIRPPGTTTDPGTTGIPPVPPLDEEELRQIALLNEAALVAFAATPNPRPPYARSTLAWDITMPTTVLPGVQVDVHLYGDGDQLVQPTGNLVVAPYGETTFALTLRTPLAARQLGTLDVSVDFGTCTNVDVAPAVFTAIVKDEANKSFPPGGKVKLRGDGASIDIGYDAFVVDIPLEAEVPNWFNANVDVSLGFSVYSVDGNVGATHDVAITKVSFGVASSILSGGCSAAVAAALEAQSDGFLSGFIGPVIAGRIARQVSDNVNENLQRLNNAHPPVPYKLYDLTLTVDGMTYRFCPERSAPPAPDHPLGDRELDPIVL